MQEWYLTWGGKYVRMYIYCLEMCPHFRSVVHIMYCIGVYLMSLSPAVSIVVCVGRPSCMRSTTYVL